MLGIIMSKHRSTSIEKGEFGNQRFASDVGVTI